MTSQPKEVIILTPSTVRVSPRVWRAAFSRQIHRRSNEIKNALREIQISLKKILKLSRAYHIVFFHSTGRGAVEAALTALIPLGKTLILVNGRWSEFMAKTAQKYDPKIRITRFNPRKPIPVQELTAILKQEKPRTVCFVAHETEQGLLNDVSAITKICKRYTAHVLVDAMSAVVIEDIPYAKLSIDAFVFNSAKALRGIECLGMVALTHALAKKLKGSNNAYLNLKEEYVNQVDSVLSAPLSPTAVFALRESLREIKEEGLSVRRSDIQKKMFLVKTWAREHLLEPCIDWQYIGNFTLPLYLPAGWTYQRFLKKIELAGYRVLYGIEGERGKTFEICVAGYLSTTDVRNFLTVTEKILFKKK